jgi:23S rRNA (pseudouridine1915-N3)-methyltransferase
MRLTVAAVGRVRSAPEQSLCDLHLERASAIGPGLGFSKLVFLAQDVSRAASPQARMEEEAAKLARRIAGPSHRIALDENGRSLSSENFAGRLARLRDEGCRDLVFFIGGPDGLWPGLRETAEERLSFGSQTWPHLLVRAMLAEQIYRAFTILAGHPYHRGRA